MPTRDFRELDRAMRDAGKMFCGGLDIDPAKIPAHVHRQYDTDADAIYHYGIRVAEETADIVGAYKPNFAFYEACGSRGLWCLEQTIAFIHTYAPHVPVILDRKAGDIGNSLEQTLKFAFDVCEADAITVHPYMGGESFVGKEDVKLLLDRKDKGAFVLCRTSNPNSDQFQRRICWVPEVGMEMPLFQCVAYEVETSWNTNGNCALVAGATYPEDIVIVRNAAGEDMPILVPAVGPQGGKLEEAVRAAANSQGQGVYLNASRDFLFAYGNEEYKHFGEENFAGAARQAALDFDRRIREAVQSVPYTS